MSQTNADRLRAGLETFNRTGEIESTLYAPDVEIRQASSIIDTAGTFSGLEGMREALGELREAFDDLSFEAEKFIEAPASKSVVFIRVRGRGRGSGAKLENTIGWVLTFREEQVVRIVVYEDPAEALAAAGLSE